jgi:hypothetical protein
MGLDIFVYKVKKSVADKYNITIDSEYNAIESTIRKNSTEEFNKATNKLLNVLCDTNKLSKIQYANDYKDFFKELTKKVKFYKHNAIWKCEQFGFNRYGKLVDVKTPTQIAEMFKFDCKYCVVEDAYFRKVNFLYEYFRNKLDNEKCKVTKGEIKELIDICKNVLNKKGDEDYAQVHLPTRSGFFFGSTDYDEGYWGDVKDCLTQMNKIYKSMSDNDFVLWEFSW